MNRLFPSVKKEMLLLVNDSVGLLFMFVMPLLLVFVITAVQDSAFRKINEGHIGLLIVNHDGKIHSKTFVKHLEASGMFTVEKRDDLAELDIISYLHDNKKQAAVFIPQNFSDKMEERSAHAGHLMLSDFDLSEATEETQTPTMPPVVCYHDPVLQEAYCQSIVNLLGTSLRLIENGLMLDMIYKQFGLESSNSKLSEALKDDSVHIIQKAATSGNLKPNTTQHNVPAWTIFAMFFIVVSLGSNIVKERLNGSFMRLKTMPVNFLLIWGSKTIVYTGISILQVVVLFSAGMFVFPLVNLPVLVLPQNLLVLFFAVIMVALSAVSYAQMVGSLSKTQEQANGVGAISIIIFAVLGGIFVPVFAMPPTLKIISHFSPLYWCLEGFYFLFLKGGNLINLLKAIWPLFVFIGACQTITYIKMKSEKMI